MDERKKTGNDGEDAACRFLASKGQQVLERNWRSGHLEIDIISFDADGIHFVEVKTRRPPMQADPQESVTATKQKRLARAALGYLNKAKNPLLRDAECHFDIVAVTIERDNSQKIEYFKDAFYPMYT